MMAGDADEEALQVVEELLQDAVVWKDKKSDKLVESG